MSDHNQIITGLSGSPIVPGELILRDGHVQWDTDSLPEFLIDKSDPRFIACQSKAQKLKTQFPLEGLNASIAADRETIVSREKAITWQLVDVIHEQFGDYNPAIAKGKSSSTEPSLHNDVKRQNTNNPASLKEFKKNELICRHYAPLFSALATEAGLPNYYVSGDANEIKNTNGVMTVEKNLSSQSTSGHAFVVSRMTGNVMEATVAEGEFAYKQQSNKLSINDIVAGKTICVPTGLNTFYTYGSQLSDDKEQQDVLIKRQALVAVGRLQDLPSYRYYGDKETQKTIDQKTSDFRSKVKIYDKKLIADHYLNDAKPLMAKLEQAVEQNDLATVQSCCRSYPVDAENIGKMLAKATAAEQLPMAQFLIAQGAWDKKNTMAKMLKSAIQKQDLRLAEFAIDNGAFDGFKNPIDTPQEKAEILFWLDLSKEKFDKNFNHAILNKLDITPDAYFERAAKSRWLPHIEVALERMNAEPKTPERIKRLQAVAEELKANSYAKQSAYIADFLDNKYTGTQQLAVAKVAKPDTPIKSDPLPKKQDPISSKTVVEEDPSVSGSSKLPITAALGGVAGILIGLLGGGSLLGVIALAVGGLLAGVVTGMAMDRSSADHSNTAISTATAAGTTTATSAVSIEPMLSTLPHLDRSGKGRAVRTYIS